MSILARTVGVLFAVSVAASASAGARLQTLAPSSPWTINYADDSCQLLRSFGSEPQRITLRFERFAPSDTFRLTIAGRPLKTSGTLYTGIKLGFEPGPSKLAGFLALSGTFGQDETPMLMAGAWTLHGRPGKIRRASLSSEEERSVTKLVIDQKDEGFDFALDLGPMDKPMTALRECTDELVTHWGLDVAAQRSLSRGVTPLGKYGDWIRSEDYPRDALNGGKNAVVNYRLTVGVDGIPTACALQGGTQGTVFQETTCRLLMKRARFTPALDVTGKPIASYFVSSVSWVIS